MNSSDPDMLLQSEGLFNQSITSFIDEGAILTLTNILVPIAFGIILTVGLIGNILVITVVRKNCYFKML